MTCELGCPKRAIYKGEERILVCSDCYPRIEEASSEEARGVIQRLSDALEAAEHAADEIEKLRGWKAEALIVLSEWEKTWIAAGRPGRLGTSKAASVRAEIERLRGEGDWEYGVHLGATSEVRAHTSRRLAVSDARSKSTTTYPDGRVEVFDRVLMRRRKAGPWEPVEGDGDA